MNKKKQSNGTKVCQAKIFRAEEIVTNLNGIFLVFDEKLKLTFLSDVCVQTIFRERQYSIGMSFMQTFSEISDKEWVQKTQKQCKKVLSTASKQEVADTLSFNGLDWRTSISPILKENKCEGVIVTLTDITGMVAARRQVEELVNSQNSFLKNMSHEIRTPMNAVKGLSELLALTDMTVLQRNYVNNIIISANSLLGIINDVLDFAKIDSENVSIVESPYILSEFITGICNVTELKAEEKKLALYIETPAALPSILSGDDIRIKQILNNLLSNAVKFTSEGFIKLSIQTEVKDKQTYLMFQIQDSGIGISPGDMPHLFSAFSRADLSANRSIAGTGLGLAISKQIVEAMGGEIWIESVYGVGTKASFRIPQTIVDLKPIAEVENVNEKHVLLLAKGEQRDNIVGMLNSLDVTFVNITDESQLKNIELGAFTHCIYSSNYSEKTIRQLMNQIPEARFAALQHFSNAMNLSEFNDVIIYLPVFITEIADFINKTAGINENQEKNIQLKNVTTLVVDDNEINLVVSGEMLKSLGAEVVCAESGFDAIELCKQQKFDIIFMDHMMPAKDGVETTVDIRKTQNLNVSTPIVALTANVAKGIKGLCLNAGMNDFLSKPISLTSLIRTLRRWIVADKISRRDTMLAIDCAGVRSEIASPEALIEAFDKFGLYASDVMREIKGDFNVYVSRIDDVSRVLGGVVAKLKAEYINENWQEFSQSCLVLRSLLFGIGARDCAGRARKLAVAAQEGNIRHIRDDFDSLMGNMYMLEKKLVVIVPFVNDDKMQTMPINAPKYLSICLERIGDAIEKFDIHKALKELDEAAAYSLDMELDMALKSIKTALENNDFSLAKASHLAISKKFN